MIKSKHFSLRRLHSIEKHLERVRKKPQTYEIPQEDLFVDSHVFMEMFKINVRTLRRWRKKKLIPYSRIKGRFFFRLGDIESFIEENVQT